VSHLLLRLESGELGSEARLDDFEIETPFPYLLNINPMLITMPFKRMVEQPLT
jgi:hypothetical protein